jgi:hypothetical protein
MLDEQLRSSKQSKMYGNMTQMEKRMNRNDLYAYKHNDNNQYCLVPGFNTIKNDAKPEMIKVHKTYDSVKGLERLKK